MAVAAAVLTVLAIGATGAKPASEAVDLAGARTSAAATARAADLHRHATAWAGAKQVAGSATLRWYTDGSYSLEVCDRKGDGWGVVAYAHVPRGSALLEVRDPAADESCRRTTASKPFKGGRGFAVTACVYRGHKRKDCNRRAIADYVYAGAKRQAGLGVVDLHGDNTVGLRVCDRKADGWGVRARLYDAASGSDLLSLRDPKSAGGCTKRRDGHWPLWSKHLRMEVCLYRAGRTRDCRDRSIADHHVPSRTTRVMTFNIQKGRGAGEKPAKDPMNIARTAAAIRAVNPDIVAVQEIQREEGRDPWDELANRLGMNVVLGNNRVEKCKNFNPDEEIVDGKLITKGGNAILFRKNYKLLGKGKVILPVNSKLDKKACRAVMWVALEIGSEKVVVFNTHVTEGRGAEAVQHRQKQVKAIINTISKRRCGHVPHCRVILTGDFNAKPDEATIQLVRDDGFVDTWKAARGNAPGYTHPSGNRGRGRIDYIFASPIFDVGWAGVPKTRASDHNPVFVDLRF